MKLLIITPYVPYPINSGGNLGFFGLVDRIRKLVDVSVLLRVRQSQEKDVEALQKIWDNVTFYIYRTEDNLKDKLSFKYRLMNDLSESFERKVRRERNARDTDFVRQHSVASYNNSSFYKPLEREYVSFIDSVLRDTKFDLVQVDFFELIDVVDILPKEQKKVFIHHELRYVRSECELNLFANANPTDIYTHNYSKAYEMQHLRLYDGVVCMTEIDKQKLIDEELEASQLYVSPAIVDLKTDGLRDEFNFKNKLVYLGGSDHFPNFDAVDWFLKTCWDKIYANNPSLEFHVIGSWKSKVKKHYAQLHPGVKFRGFVDDLTTELEDAIMVVPLRIGSGVRMKILEAISLGCPIVSTHIGAEGIGLKDNEDVLYANNEIEFVDAIYRLSMNNELCKLIRQGAYSKLLDRKTPDELAEVRYNIYKEIVK